MVEDKLVRRSLWVGEISVFESRLPYTIIINFYLINIINKNKNLFYLLNNKILKETKGKYFFLVSWQNG
jgi:hypothetical protein